MRVVIVPCLRDNYAYLVIARDGDTVVIDASEAEPVRRALSRERAHPRAIWSTHHHVDHTGGNVELASEYGIEVVGHASDAGRLTGLTHSVEHEDVLSVGAIRARCLHVPGHTSGAVAYFVEEAGAVFTGDTLFSAGCGRLFEGTPARMAASLSTLSTLPDDVRVFSGHEYTEDNLRFAATMEPSNQEIVSARRRAAALRDGSKPTVGTTLDEERRTNPFLRLSSPELRQVLSIPEGIGRSDRLRPGAEREGHISLTRESSEEVAGRFRWPYRGLRPPGFFTARLGAPAGGVLRPTPAASKAEGHTSETEQSAQRGRRASQQRRP